LSSSSLSSSASPDSRTLKHLYTRWTLRPFPFRPPADAANPRDSITSSTTNAATTHSAATAAAAAPPPVEQTDVSLALEFQFANPVYAAMSRAVAPRVAAMMVEAFGRRALAVLGPPRQPSPAAAAAAVKDGGTALEGVLSGGGSER
jgi:coenzyme Q-binding protein COQ10